MHSQTMVPIVRTKLCKVHENHTRNLNHLTQSQLQDVTLQRNFSRDPCMKHTVNTDKGLMGYVNPTWPNKGKKFRRLEGYHARNPLE